MDLLLHAGAGAPAAGAAHAADHRERAPLREHAGAPAAAGLAEAHGPIMMLKIGPMPLVVVTSRELAREVLKVQDPNFANRPRLLVGGICGYGWTDIIFAPTSDYWRKIRKLCIHEILSPKRVLQFQFIREEVRRQVDLVRAAAAAGQPVDVTRMVYDISSRTISRSAFGEVRPDMPVFQHAIKRVVGLSSGFNVPDLFPRLREPARRGHR
ncbi:hypothetical protein ZWY2020_051002 [Hordeum vulgare]|nr:hypothetical protein ZWY2020_051002 [Hordeum vulgare]